MLYFCDSIQKINYDLLQIVQIYIRPRAAIGIVTYVNESNLLKKLFIIAFIYIVVEVTPTNLLSYKV